MEVIDKSTWGDGPWQTEPDELDWTDAITGLRCQIRRNPHMGMLCGYVGVPAEHPLFGRHYDEANEHVEVHGGLTYSGPLPESNYERTGQSLYRRDYRRGGVDKSSNPYDSQDQERSSSTSPDINSSSDEHGQAADRVAEEDMESRPHDCIISTDETTAQDSVQLASMERERSNGTASGLSLSENKTVTGKTGNPIKTEHASATPSRRRRDGQTDETARSNADVERDEESSSHLAGLGELHWLGFDCGHAWDLSPGLQSMLPPHLRETQMGIPVHYRDIHYVHDQCTALAWQIHQLTEELSQTQSSFGGGAG